MAGTQQRPGPQSARCDRARQWASLRLDGELSELEDALLERHLETCGECRAFDVHLSSTTHVLRTAAAEAPAAGFEFPPARIRFPISRRLAIAAVATAAALGSLVGSNLNRPTSRPEHPVPQVSFLTRDLQQLRELPRQQRAKPVAPVRQPGVPPEGII